MSDIPPFETANATSLDIERRQFLSSLVHAGLVSEEFAESGVVEKFAIDEVAQTDAIKHVLIGDKNGGVHHLPTVMGLDVGNVSVASKIAHVQPADGDLYALRNRQRVQSNGVFRAAHVHVSGGYGDVRVKGRGSVMFPNDWSTEQVLQAVVRASESPQKRVVDGNATSHFAKIDGVRVVAKVDNTTGKIISGYPR